MFKEIIKYGELEAVYKEKEILSKKPRLTNLFWESTLRCNANCKHCGSRAGENINIKDELTTEEIKNTLKSISEKYDASKMQINVTGGEPLLRKDLFEVMKYAKQLGFYWSITTNGILITDEVIEKFKETEISTMSISIDGLETTHNEFRGLPNCYSKIIENIKKIKKSNFNVILQVTTVTNKSNIKELEEIYEVVKELNIDSWRILNMDPIGRAKDNKKLELDSEDYKYLINFIKEKRKKSKFDVTYGCAHFLGIKYEKEVRSNMYMCYTGLTVGSILYNGDIFVCPNVERRPELIQGNVRKDDFVKTWENKFEFFRNLEKFKCGKCNKCEDWKYCLGGAFHTWDFENEEQQICLKEILN